MKRKRRTKKRASEPGKAPSLKAQQQKVRKLQQLVEDLERGENFNITRLVVIKSLCQDVKLFWSGAPTAVNGGSANCSGRRARSTTVARLDS